MQMGNWLLHYKILKTLVKNLMFLLEGAEKSVPFFNLKVSPAVFGY